MQSTKPLRVDAQRNRDALLTAATEAFAQDGPDVALETIAARAGVGIGTLYRHFPNREALAEAVYRDELTQLAESAPLLLAENRPEDALVAWVRGFSDYIATKRSIADALRATAPSGVSEKYHARSLLAASMQQILDAGAASGALRDGLLGGDVVASLVGIELATREGGADAAQQAARMTDLVLSGIRA